jgi:hypothetical protein
MNIKIAHEAPLALIPLVRELTDYDYLLAHHCYGKRGDEYKKLFTKRSGRLVVLDNSAFELGESIDTDQYLDLIEEIRPDWVMLPDRLGDKEKTLELSKICLDKLRDEDNDINVESLGVLQGHTLEEMVECALNFVELGVTRLAVPSAAGAYTLLHPKLDRDMARVFGRVNLVTVLSGLFCDPVRLHLLGCSSPLEFTIYRSKSTMHFIESMDTSAPVVAALLGEKYKEDYGSLQKPSLSLDTVFENCDFTELTKYRVCENMSIFSRIVNPGIHIS